MSGKTRIETLTLKPSEVAAAIRAAILTRRAVFDWGPPGCAKSAIVRQIADGMGVAFIDIRLSQMDPTDLRGMPYPVVENGVHGMQWAPPLALPRDLDLTETRETKFATTMRINLSGVNPCGSNGIRYVTDPTYEVKSIGESGVARIVRQDAAGVEFGIYDDDGRLMAGAVEVRVTGKARGIVAFEEFNSAPPSVVAASYQLILDQRLGNYVVPEGCYQLALGNRDTDKGVTFKMGPPIRRRFIHIEQRVDHAEWEMHALERRFHPEVVGYLAAFKESLFIFDPADSASRNFPCPATWEFVSDLCNANEYLSEQVALALFSGCVGDAEGAKFVAFRKIAHALPRAADILSGKLTMLPKKVEVQLAYALTTTLCYELKTRSDEIIRKHGEAWKQSNDRKEWTKEADMFLSFIMDNFGPEINVMGARAAIAIHKLPFDTLKMKNFAVFATKYKDLIVAEERP